MEKHKIIKKYKDPKTGYSRKREKPHVEWFPKSPPRGLRLQQLEFQILKVSKRDARVFIFYFDFPHKVDFHRFKQWLDTKFAEVVMSFATDAEADRMLRDRQDTAKRQSKFMRKIVGNDSAVFIKALSYIRSQTEKERFTEIWEKKRQEDISNIENFVTKKVNGKKQSYGIYDQRTANEILSKKIKINNISPEVIAAGTNMNPATVYKHLSNDLDVTREQAISYAKFFGMDPSEILFNDLKIPLQGEVDFLESSHNKSLAEPGNKIIFKPGEIRPMTKEGRIVNEYVNCPRDIYRPDVKAVKIVSDPSPFTNHIVFYYQDRIEPHPFDLCVFIKKEVDVMDELKIVADKLNKSFEADPLADAKVTDKDIHKKIDQHTKLFLENTGKALEIMQRGIKKTQYYIGYYEQDGEKTNILNIDSSSLPPAEAFEPDCEAGDEGELVWTEPPNPYDVIEDSRYILKDAKPDAIVPVVAIVDVAKLKKDDRRSDLIKKESQWTLSNRLSSQIDKAEFAELLKSFKEQNLLQGKMVSNYKEVEKSWEEIIGLYKQKESIWKEVLKENKEHSLWKAVIEPAGSPKRSDLTLTGPSGESVELELKKRRFAAKAMDIYQNQKDKLLKEKETKLEKDKKK